MNSIELFAGAGGLTLGLKQAGFSPEILVERDAHCGAALRRNARLLGLEGSTAILQRDVQTVDFRDYRDIDLLAGGPPCQPFSTAGRGSGQQDPRDMFPQIVRAVRECGPKAFLIENVPGLMAPRHREYRDYILMQLRYPEVIAHPGESWQSHLGRLEACLEHGVALPVHYDIHVLQLNAADYGVAQTRMRVFLIGFRSDLALSWIAPTATHENPSKLDGRRTAVAGTGAAAPVTRDRQPWLSIRDVVHDLPAFGTPEAEALEHRSREGARPYPGHTGSPYDMPSKALKAGVHGSPGGENMIDFGDGQYRYLSIREAARVQGFPDDYSFEGVSWSRALRLLGNAVPVPLASKVGIAVAAALRSDEALATDDTRRRDQAA